MSGGVAMPTACPQCQTATDPADFHVKPAMNKEGLDWTYECRGCGDEKPTEEWVALHNAKFGTSN